MSTQSCIFWCWLLAANPSHVEVWICPENRADEDEENRSLYIK